MIHTLLANIRSHMNTYPGFEKPGFATWSTPIKNSTEVCKDLIQVSEDSLLVQNIVTETLRNQDTTAGRW